MARTPLIDVSYWQGDIDWDAVVADGVMGVIMRACYGDWADPKFPEYWQQAGDRGLLRGAYHFCRAHQDVNKQIDLFCETVPKNTEIQPVYDLERYYKDPVVTGKPLVEFSDKYLAGVEAEFDRLMLIYTNYYFWKDNMRVNLQYPNYFKTRDLWLAQYVNGIPTNPYLWHSSWPDTWAFWQYTSKGSVPGISGNVDMDLFNGSYDDLLLYCGKTPSQPTDLEKRVETLENANELLTIRVQELEENQREVGEIYLEG